MNFYPTFFITSATSAPSKLTLVASGSPSTSAKSVSRFVFAPNLALPSGASSSDEVEISINSTSYPVLGKFGDALTVGELPTVTTSAGTFLRPRVPLTCGLGDTSFVCWSLPVPTEYVIPLR